MSNELEHGKYVPGIGPSTGAKLAIVGLAPYPVDVHGGASFSGPHGKILDQALRQAGTSLPECYRTNLFKYPLPDNDFKKHEEIKLNLTTCVQELKEELSVYNPNCILGFGDSVLYALTGKSGKHNNIGVWRGSIIPALGRKSVFTWSPASSLPNSDEGQWKPWQEGVMYFDINRAVQQSQTPEFNPYRRALHIANNSADLYRFFERYAGKEYCSVDIESIENIPVCIGLSFSPHEAICVPLWGNLHIQIKNHIKPKLSSSYNLKVSEISNMDLALIYQMLAWFFMNPKYKKIGQNFKYDEDKLNRLGFYLDRLYADIMLGSHVISPELPKGLAFQTSIYTEEAYYKFEGRLFIPQKDNIRDFFLYCCKDAACTIEIFFKQQEEMKEIPGAEEHFYNFRMKLHKLYMHIDSTGFLTDEEKRWELIVKYVNWQLELEKELTELVGFPINVNSPKQVDTLMYDHLQIPRRKGTGEQVITAILGNNLKHGRDTVKIRILENILTTRRVMKTIGTYMMAPLDYPQAV